MISKKILTVLLAAVSLPSFVSAQAPLPDADPAMWVVKDADTTIYLFGTVHALDGKRDWFNDEVKTAYDASKEVVFEILIPDPAKAQATILKLAKNEGGKGLSAMLTPEQAKKLGAELASVGAPVTAFDQFEPWFAATQLAQIRFMKKGIKPEHGVEAKLREAALKDGKTLGEVESFEWQMNLFDGLPKEMQLAMITGYLDEFEKGDEMMDKMMVSWAAGDIDTLSGIMNEALSKSPELSKLLLADRNARWADWIQKRLDKPGAVFMAVGAGHLGGKDSVQDYLAKKGLKAVRVKS
jgi:uncharacterized protein YbaP (TraB family)